MPVHNGKTINNVLYAKGDITWADKTDWSAYTKWIEYTDTTIQTATGAKGQPLRWRSDIIDFGLVRTVYPDIYVSANGTPKVVIESSMTSSDLSSATGFDNKYTADNTTTGAIQTYAVLDGMEPGYTDQGSTATAEINVRGITARYVRVTVYVEEFLPDLTRGQPVITEVNIAFKSDTVERTYTDATNATFTFRSDLSPQQFALPQYGNHPRIVSLQVTPHHTSSGEDIKALITAKTSGGRFTMMKSDATVLTSWTADVTVKTLPDVRETFTGIQKAK